MIAYNDAGVKGRSLPDTSRNYYQNAAQNILIYDELERLVRLIDAKRIPVIVLKGAVLSRTVYTNFAKRRMGDIDLLIHPDDRDSVERILEMDGYKYYPEQQEKFGPFNTNFTGEKTYSRNGIVFIDLHWELTPVEWLRRIINLDMDAIWLDAEPISLEDGRSLQLSPVDTILHLCIHLLAQNFAYPQGFEDISRVIAHYQPFLWDNFLIRVQQFRMVAISYFVLSTLSTAQASHIPTKLLDQLRPGAFQRWLVYHIADPSLGMQGKLGYNRQLSYLLHLSVADHWVYSMKVVVWMLFPGPKWLSERYQLRRPGTTFFACLWHPFVVIWQGLSGILAFTVGRFKKSGNWRSG